MSRSSLLGTDHTPTEPAGRDTDTLGPGDSSDSGSDMMGLADFDDAEFALPVDVGLREGRVHPDTCAIGERRSAASDAGVREGADIGVDRIFSVGATGDPEAILTDDEDPDLSFMDEAEAGDPLEDEDEDDDEEPLPGDAPERHPLPVPRRRRG